MPTDPSKFPYKTLIWALFALIAIFIFKTELKKFLSQAEGVSIFGVEITASKEKMHTLQDSIQSFVTTITDLSSQLENQQKKLNNLDKLKSELEQDLANCPEAQNTSKLFSKQVNQIFNTNTALRIKSDKLKNTNIINLPTYNVKLILPSNMINADIYVDKKKATIVKKSGTYITVRVIKKSGSYRFEIKNGTNSCSIEQVITKDNMELPIICDF